MKAIIINDFGDPSVLETVDLPRPKIAADEILVRIYATAVNPKDTFIRKGYLKRYTGTDMPMMLGFDYAGEVIERGQEVAQFQIGDPVWGMLDGWHGRTYAQYIAIPAGQAATKPASLSYNEAAALPLVASTALQAFRDEADLQVGQRVCINGASGGVGSAAVQIARILAAHITAISRKENHLFLQQLGANVCLDYRETDITQSDQPFDVFFDVFGNQPFDKIKPLLTPQGVWVSTVLQPHVFASVEATKNSSGKKAKLVIVKNSRADLDILRGWIESGRLKPIVHSTYPFHQMAAAHTQQESKHTQGKIVIEL